jgi:hypothetical protein
MRLGSVDLHQRPLNPSCSFRGKRSFPQQETAEGPCEPRPFHDEVRPSPHGNHFLYVQKGLLE